MNELAEVFTASTVRKLAGSRSYPRGFAYYRDGRVEPAGRSGPWSPGKGAGHDTLYGQPVGGWGSVRAGRAPVPPPRTDRFCKHCVAMAVSLDPDVGSPSAVSVVRAGNSSPLPDRELAHFVGQLPKGRLVEIVLKEAASDWQLRERLLAEIRSVQGEGPDLAAWQRRIARSFAPNRGGFVSYREAKGWAAGIQEVIDGLVDVCEAGHPDAVVSLADHACGCADKAAEYVDDSDGWLSVIAERLSDLHHRACSEGRPDPAELAARLVALELDSDLGGFYRAAAAYAEIPRRSRSGRLPRASSIGVRLRWRPGATMIQVPTMPSNRLARRW